MDIYPYAIYIYIRDMDMEVQMIRRSRIRCPFRKGRSTIFVSIDDLDDLRDLWPADGFRYTFSTTTPMSTATTNNTATYPTFGTLQWED